MSLTEDGHTHTNIAWRKAAERETFVQRAAKHQRTCGAPAEATTSETGMKFLRISWWVSNNGKTEVRNMFSNWLC